MASIFGWGAKASKPSEEFQVLGDQADPAPAGSKAAEEVAGAVLGSVEVRKIDQTPAPFQGDAQYISMQSLQGGGKGQASSHCGLLQVVSLVIAFVSALFLAFSLCYGAGFFRFEAFLGPVGSTVFPSTGGALVLLSGILLYCSFRSNH